MSERLEQLQELQALLHEVNQEWARSARPLKWSPELNDDQRQQLGITLRAVQDRWEAVTQKIEMLLHADDAKHGLLGTASSGDRGRSHLTESTVQESA